MTNAFFFEGAFIEKRVAMEVGERITSNRNGMYEEKSDFLRTESTNIVTRNLQFKIVCIYSPYNT